MKKRCKKINLLLHENFLPRKTKSMAFKLKRQSRKARSRNRHCSRMSTRSCTDIGKKRVLVLDTEKVKGDLFCEEKLVPLDDSPPMQSPKRPSSWPVMGLADGNKQKLPGTPKTPRTPDISSGSTLESLPMDLLVKILCHLHHDQLRAVFHVSRRISEAVTIARKCHFDYTTPDRARQEMLRTKTPLATERWPFGSKVDGKGTWGACPRTPKAPKHGPRPPSRLKRMAVRQVAAVLFQECGLHSRCMMPPSLPRPCCKALGSNRVLFYEEELCQAVAQNKLR